MNNPVDDSAFQAAAQAFHEETKKRLIEADLKSVNELASRAAQIHQTPLQMGHAASYPQPTVSQHVIDDSINAESEKWRAYQDKLKRWKWLTATLMDHLSNVRSFTTTFGQPAPAKPTVPSPELAALRHKLLSEESAELVDAKTLTSCLDAVCDQLYVALGNAVACGFTAEQINRGLTEVHRSNMTKLWTMQEINENCALGMTIDFHTEPVELDDRVHVVRSSTGKILKPPGYSPADLSWIEEEGK